MPSLYTLLALCVFPANFAFAAEGPLDQRGRDFFEKQIRPVLVKHCYECHSVKSKELGGNLFLDNRAGSRTGGENGPAVVPKNLQKSLLINAIEYKSSEMPPSEKLPDNVIADFKKWIRMGAPDPRDGKMPVLASKNGDEKTSAKATDLWSLKPIEKVKPPVVKNKNWPRTDIDRFVLAKLESNNLQPVADADPVTLLRRLSFDLVGLPPTADHFDRIVSDPSQKTFETIIDELIASPQFGERWARHWLDVARYAESAGSSRDVLMPVAWKYRDYVIDAFNADLPYPQFITEQIAGDLLPAETDEERERLQLATGFLAVGQKSLNGGNVQLDIVDDQIDVIGKSVLGLTISCARCHDHKFDPIPTQDYYSLAGIFLSTETLFGGGTNRPKNNVDRAKVYLTMGDNIEETLKVLTDLNKQLVKLNKDRITKTKRLQALTKKLPKDWKKQKSKLEQIVKAAQSTEETEEKLRELTKNEKALLKQIADFETAQTALNAVLKQIAEINKQVKAAPPLAFAVGVREGKKISDTPIRVRGESKQRGKVAPRGFLQCIDLDEQQVLEEASLQAIDQSQSGRLQLAAWLTHADNPLTRRVAVNRIWLHLFGRGIVETADNFGISGLPPSHPELLDFLATQFIENDWSVKKLIAEIVKSRTYQLSSVYNPTNYSIDPANKLYWRQSQRRLEAEAIRDAMLVSAGELSFERPEFGSTVAKIGEGEVGRGINTKLLDDAFPYRSVYLPIIRGILPESLNKFDFPEPSNPQSSRGSTNVPAQSLYFMNSPFVVEQAEKTAQRVVASGVNRTERTERAFRLVLGRSPRKNEIKRINDFITESLKNQKSVDDTLQTVWTTICQSLFASAEFRFLN